MRNAVRRSPAVFLPLIAMALTAHAAELTQATVDAFDRYIAAVEEKLEPRFHGTCFLGTEDAAGRRSQLRRGEVIVQPSLDRGVVPIKGGLIQDWTGAVFIPDSSLKRVLSIVQDYGHHQDFYKPEVAQATVRSRTGDDFQVFMRIVKAKMLLSDVLNTEHEIRFTPVDARRVFSRAYSRRIAEVIDAGKPEERELAVGKDRGFLWRIYGYWFFEESDGGVYIACQSITLTRDLPFTLGKILGPIIRELPGESVRTSLEQTRRAILAR